MPDSESLVLVSTLCLICFVVLSIVDGVYLHLFRYRLFARPASYREHLWHTGRAALFAPILWLVFLRQSGGVLLWVGVGFIALDQIVELLAFSSADPGSDRGLACLHVRCGRESSHGPSSGRGLLAAAGQPAIDCRCRS